MMSRRVSRPSRRRSSPMTGTSSAPFSVMRPDPLAPRRPGRPRPAPGGRRRTEDAAAGAPPRQHVRLQGARRRAGQREEEPGHAPPPRRAW
jgi:hypothetical protein